MQEEFATRQKVYDVLVEFIVKYSFQIVGALIILVIEVKLVGWMGRIVIRFCEKRVVRMLSANDVSRETGTV